MRKVLADTVEYCKQRQQFDHPIGRFQVLQHRMVDMHMELAIGHYFKRLTAIQYEFGSTDYHVARYASLTKP